MASVTSQDEVAGQDRAGTGTKPDKSTFVGPVKPVWCAGCGDYGVLNALRRALLELELLPEQVMISSGIGCSSRLPAYVGVYGYHTLHGRGLPIAVGAYLANPDLTHIVVGGDGDLFSIGGGHFPHAARRNPDITVIALDNNIYGLTKGQPSPTTAPEFKPKAMPIRPMEEPLNPAMMCLAYDVSFFARAYVGSMKQMTQLFIDGLSHPGFAVIHVLTPCVSFNNTYMKLKDQVQSVPEDHDVTNRNAAMAMAEEIERPYVGLFYKVQRPTLLDIVQSHRERAGQVTEPDLEKLFDRYS